MADEFLLEAGQPEAPRSRRAEHQPGCPEGEGCGVEVGGKVLVVEAVVVPAEALFGFFPSLEFDSFVSIGLLTDTNDAMLDIGIDWTDFESNGGDIYTNNGTWFATPDDDQVMEVGGRVLIGQFTTDGNITGEINILGKNADLSSWQYTNVALPAPGAIAILCLAGYLGVRRRR